MSDAPIQEFERKIGDTQLRFQAARFLNMPLVNVVAGIPIFSGTQDQFEKFHRYINAKV